MFIIKIVKFKSYFSNVSGMLGNYVNVPTEMATETGPISDIKQECEEEDDLMDIVDDLKQESQPFLSEHLQFNHHKYENYVNVLDEVGPSNIKQECVEEDPLGLEHPVNQIQSIPKLPQVSVLHSLVSQEGYSNMHIMNVRYNCDKCNKSYSQKGNLKTHIKNVHENVRYNCDKCDKSFSWKHHLNRHIKSVHNNVRHNCEKCDKSFSSKTYLKAHIQAEHENVRYNCDKCDKSYSWKSELNDHMKNIHDNIRYKCDVCEKSFPRKQNLMLHIKSVHKKVRHNCDKCEKSFSKKSTLKEHIQNIHENGPYNCPKCDENFSNQSNFIAHVKSVHPIVGTVKNVNSTPNELCFDVYFNGS